MRGDTLEAMLSAYKDELSQDRYTPEYAQQQRRRKVDVVSKKVKKKLNDDALLKKLEGLTAPDDDAPQRKAGARRR